MSDAIQQATLVPSRFKIEQSLTADCAYFVEYIHAWTHNKCGWVIKVAGGTCYMTTGFAFDYGGHDTAVFDTAEEALEFWKKYVAWRFAT